MITINQEHKGLKGSATWDFDVRRYYGMINGIPVEIAYEADSLQELQRAFKTAVDEYHHSAYENLKRSIDGEPPSTEDMQTQ
jgi:predicted HicB family RNase H-like nuclease